MPARRRNTRHRPAEGRDAHGAHARQFGNLIGPCTGGIHQRCGAVILPARGDGPDAVCKAYGGNRRIRQHLPAMAAHLFGKILDHPVGVDVIGFDVIGGAGDLVVQDRHDGTGLVHRNLGAFQGGGVSVKPCVFARAAHQHKTTGAQVGLMIGVAGVVQGNDRRQPVVLFEQRRRPARGVIAKRLLGL